VFFLLISNQRKSYYEWILELKGAFFSIDAMRWQSLYGNLNHGKKNQMAAIQ